MRNAHAWFEILSDVTVGQTGLIKAVNAHPWRRGMPYWVLVLVQKGKRTLLVDGAEVYCRAQEFFLLPPNSEQMGIEVDEHEAYYLDFYADGVPCSAPARIDAARLLLPLHGHLPSEVDCFALARHLCDHAISPYASSAYLNAQMQALLFLISLHCQRAPYFARGETVRADAYLTFIKENARRSLRAADYEAVFDRSYHQMNVIFKRRFGYTLKQYHLRVRMDAAAQLMRSGRSVREAAEDCGFEDYYFFIRSFTAAHGISPAAYQKKYLI